MELQPKLIELLNKRGIRSEEELAEFLSDRPQKTHDPFLLHNMEAGVDLILFAIEKGRKICVYGDYDADGITSVVVMTEVLSTLTDRLMYYIPSRFEEGYGLNKGAIDRVRAMGAEFIITVDCGSVSCEEVEYAKELGMGILVTDHHTVTDRIADCLVINPNQPDCNYPCPWLAGCGVAFKVCQAIVRKTGLPKSVLIRTLDMVGIGTIGDIVPLVDENRTLAKYGLRAVNTGERTNLARLIDAVGLKQGHITAENVSFVIVPHLNAAGRMEHARIAADIFLSRDEELISKNIQRVCECNLQRKKIQEEIFRNCEEQVNREQAESLFLMLDMGKAHEGVTGIVAGKLAEQYYRPTVILTDTGENCLKGTGRSIPGVNIYEVLKQSEDLFERFGGHAAACGFTIRKELLPQLRQNAENRMKQLHTQNPDIFRRKIRTDLTLTGADVNPELIQQLSLLEPCGCGNTKPQVAVRGRAVDPVRMGSNGQYMRFYEVMSGRRRLECVVFRDTDTVWDTVSEEGAAGCEVIGSLGLKEWNGRVSMQMIVENVREM